VKRRLARRLGLRGGRPRQRIGATSGVQGTTYAFVRFDKRMRPKLFRMRRLRSQVKAVAVDRGGNAKRLGRHVTLLR
jgi:hypothetical protein